MDTLFIVANGVDVHAVPARDSLHVRFEGTIDLPLGGWVAARVVGPSSRYISDSYAFAQTSPVYVVRGGRPWRSADDARFLADAVTATWQQIEDAPWRSDRERAAFRTAVERARTVYEGIAAEADSATSSQEAPAGLALLLDPAHDEWRRPSPPVWRARFETSQGEFVVECTRAKAPNGSDRFYNLIRLGYYDDVRVHRVRDGYIAQWGLHGDPRVNVAWRGAAFPDDPPHGSNLRGTLAFARDTVPGTSNTQVYINLADNTRNDRDPFAVFGRVIEGMDVLERLYAGYGERSGSGVRQGLQGPIIEGGNAYLDREFPLLDHILRARIVGG